VIPATANAGIVTLAGYATFQEGQYSAVWAPEWRIVTDAQAGIDGFRSTERWQLLAVVDGVVVLVVPGCKVFSWVRVADVPALQITGGYFDARRLR
jgi:hypothetical protein